MLHLPFLAHLMRVRGQKSERLLRIAFVFREVKRHSAELMPDGIDRLQKRPRPPGERGRAHRHELPQVFPRLPQEINREVFEAIYASGIVPWALVEDEMAAGALSR